jgi:sensor histidine kinase YesM
LNCAPGLLTFEIFNRKTNIGIKDSSGGIGLQNVKRRLELIYPEKYKLEIVDNDEKFDVKLEVSE